MDDGGISRLQRRFAAIPKAIRDEIQPSLTRNSNNLAKLMKQLAPEEEGDLRESIRVEQGSHELSRAVVAGGEKTTREVRSGSGVTYDYAMAQELGTKEMPANPFFYPAKRLLAKKITRSLKSAASRAVKKNWGSS